MENRVNVPQFVYDFAVNLHDETEGKCPLLICYDVTAGDDEKGYHRIGETGKCLYEPQHTFYLHWIAGVHKTYTDKGMIVEWNVFEMPLGSDTLKRMREENLTIEAANQH